MDAWPLIKLFCAAQFISFVFLDIDFSIALEINHFTTLINICIIIKRLSHGVFTGQG